MGEKKGVWYELVKGIIKENPIFVIVLGLCPTLAVSTQTINGIMMGLAVIFVLTMSNLIISLIKGFVPEYVRIPVYITVIATFVTIVDLVMKAYFPLIYEAMGIFIPLIVVNCIILGRAEAFASKNGVLESIMDGLGMGVGYTLAITLIAFIREILGNGTITLKVQNIGAVIDIKQVFANQPIAVFILPPGGFLIIGLLLAFFKYIGEKSTAKTQKAK